MTTAAVGMQIRQEDAIRQLNADGFIVSERTLTYWRSKDLLPPLVRNGNEYLMTDEDIERVKILCTTGDKPSKPETLTLYRAESDVFIIERIEIIRVDSRVKALFHTLEGGFLVKEMREDELDAITGDD